MAAAALVRSDRLDKPSLMLAGQPEKEVRANGRLRVGCLCLDPRLIMNIGSHPLHCDQNITSLVAVRDVLTLLIQSVHQRVTH